jgi:V/A-type H+-transporting ATPase subunit I
MPLKTAPFPGLRVAWLGHEDHLMALCFLIGAIHLTLAHAWNIIRYMGSGKALEQVGWICTTWVMYFLARNMILGSPLPSFLSQLFMIGLALIFIFMSPLRQIRKTWSNYVVLPLNIVGNFVDLVSYIRLFAVGMATFSVASAFNEMALGIGFGKVGNGLLAASILFFGHLLNMALAGMGVLVHGIRLNALEFSTHLGLEWSGTRFLPFKKQATVLGEEE